MYMKKKKKHRKKQQKKRASIQKKAHNQSFLLELNWQAIFYLILLFAMPMARAMQLNNERYNIYEDICTDTSLIPVNMPNIRIGGLNGTYIPMSCLFDDEILCASEKKLIANFATPRNEIKTYNEARQTIVTSIRNIKMVMNHEIDNLKPMTTSQLNIMKMLFDQYIDHSSHYLSVTVLAKFKRRACGDLAFSALHRIKQRQAEHEQDDPVHLGSLSKIVNGRMVDNHAFVLIGYTGPDINSNNATLIDLTFNANTTGKFCDIWNHGKFEDIATENGGLYSTRAGWNSIMIRSFTIHYPDLAKLNRDAKALFCRKFEEIGLKLLPKSLCSIFSSSQSTSQLTPEEKNERIKEMKQII